MVTILMVSAKMASLSLLKINVFWNKGYDVITSVHDVTSNIFSCDSIYIVNAIMGSKIGNSTSSTKEVTITSIL